MATDAVLDPFATSFPRGGTTPSVEGPAAGTTGPRSGTDEREQSDVSAAKPTMAQGGRRTSVQPAAPKAPVFPGASTHPDAEYVPDEEFDSSDLALVNRELNRARARLFRVSQALRDAQRDEALADIAYRRGIRRELVSLSGGSAESRKALAELACEGAEDVLVVSRQVADEWKKRAMDARDDLKAIENLSHNVRAQMDVR